MYIDKTEKGMITINGEGDLLISKNSKYIDPTEKIGQVYFCNTQVLLAHNIKFKTKLFYIWLATKFILAKEKSPKLL
jgi:hypothetical protein